MFRHVKNIHFIGIGGIGMSGIAEVLCNLVPAAGILDVLDNYAFVRTSGYLPGSEDVYLSLSMVRKFGLRRGDAVVGQVRQPREGERREKFKAYWATMLGHVKLFFPGSRHLIDKA